MRSGNVSQLDKALQAKQWHFIRKGTYLLLEKLKQSVARRLLKKIYLLKVEKGNQLHLGMTHYFLLRFVIHTVLSGHNMILYFFSFNPVQNLGEDWTFPHSGMLRNILTLKFHSSALS